MSHAPTLRGRDRECERLRGLITEVEAGRSQVLVLRGDTGIGKTTLLDFMADQAHGCRITRFTGVESEMEIAFAGLHQFCAPFLDHLDTLPPPQRDALATTFGLKSSIPPDPFLVGLAALTLLSDVAEVQPLICIIDDAQWLDAASLQTLEFVSRRLGAERIAMMFAARDTEPRRLSALPEMLVAELSPHEASALLDGTIAGPLDEQVRDRILVEARGNPLALLELPRIASSAELAFGPSPGSGGATSEVAERLESSFLRQLQDLPQHARRLLLLAAADPVGDLPRLWRAADSLGVPHDAAESVEDSGLLDLRQQAAFRHPFIRTTVVRAATLPELREVHAALAEVTDPVDDPDRRAWHRARATVGPDDDVAVELASCSDRALARGGLTAAAAFLHEAARLTPDPARRSKRSLAAAEAKAAAGAFDDALALLAIAQAGPLEEYDQAKLDLLQAQISHNSQHGNKALPLLLGAAKRLEAIDPRLARETYLDAFAAAMFAGRLAPGEGIGMQHVATAMCDVRLPPEPTKSDALLYSIGKLYASGSYTEAAPDLLRVVGAFGRDDLDMDEAVRFAWLAACVATDLWDDRNWGVLTSRHLDAIRGIGAVAVLPVALTSRVVYDLYAGDLVDAEALIAETRWIEDVTGGQNTMLPYGAACLNAMSGRTSTAETQFSQLLSDISTRGEGVGLNMVGWFQAIMYNAVGNHEAAFAAARLASASPLELGPPKWALAELIEAAVGLGEMESAAEALEQMSTYARASGTEAALGVLAGRTALLRTGGAAEDSHLEEIDRLGRTTLRVEQARAHLRYGEWLQGEGRRDDAREQLTTAHEALTFMGVRGFAARAREALAVAGGTAREEQAAPGTELTAQERHLARLVTEGLTNPEIGAAVYLSPRTVEWHLRKVFTKLGVRNRRELQRALAASSVAAAS